VTINHTKNAIAMPFASTKLVDSTEFLHHLIHEACISDIRIFHKKRKCSYKANGFCEVHTIVKTPFFGLGRFQHVFRRFLAVKFVGSKNFIWGCQQNLIVNIPGFPDGKTTIRVLTIKKSRKVTIRVRKARMLRVSRMVGKTRIAGCFFIPSGQLANHPGFFGTECTWRTHVMGRQSDDMSN
jgi:hypothetical protein